MAAKAFLEISEDALMALAIDGKLSLEKFPRQVRIRLAEEILKSAVLHSLTGGRMSIHDYGTVNGLPPRWQAQHLPANRPDRDDGFILGGQLDPAGGTIQLCIDPDGTFWLGRNPRTVNGASFTEGFTYRSLDIEQVPEFLAGNVEVFKSTVCYLKALAVRRAVCYESLARAYRQFSDGMDKYSLTP